MWQLRYSCSRVWCSNIWIQFIHVTNSNILFNLCFLVITPIVYLICLPSIYSAINVISCQSSFCFTIKSDLHVFWFCVTRLISGCLIFLQGLSPFSETNFQDYSRTRTDFFKGSKSQIHPYTPKILPSTQK